MKVKEITNVLGNDLYGTIQCEHCGNIEKFVGYNDYYYHEKVLPSRHCNKCGKNRAGKTV